MKQLKFIEFIKDDKNWEELLQQERYCLKIKRDNNYIIFILIWELFSDILREII